MKTLIFVSTLCLIVACSSAPKRPGWIENAKEGVVASSGTHVMGRHAQEELAIARARERLAARLGVEVSSDMTIREQVRNEQFSVSSDKDMTLSVKGKEVSARVKEKWYDRESDTVWVWVVTN